MFEWDSDIIGMPTIDEIREATDFLIPVNSSDTDVQMKGSFAVRYGNRVPFLDAQRIEYTAVNGKAPMAHIFAVPHKRDTNTTFILMEYILGANLQEV